MNPDDKKMRNIWFFVGLIMFAIGIIVFAAGIVDLMFPGNNGVRLEYLHANIWWGIIIWIIGLVFIIKNKNKYINM